MPPSPGNLTSILITTQVGLTNVTNLLKFSPPSIVGVTPKLASTSTTALLTISGSSFGTLGTVTVGTKACVVISYTHVAITCQLAMGTGSYLKVSVNRTSSVPFSTAAQLAMFSYGLPTMTSVYPNQCKTDGSSLLNITGDNFGPVGSTISVLYRVIPLSAILVTPHKVISFICPAGYGSGNTVAVSIDGQTSASISISYLAPIVYSVAPTSLPTSGGNLVQIRGENFGAPGADVSVQFGAMPLFCIVTEFSHTSINCTSPPGSGTPGTTIQVDIYIYMHIFEHSCYVDSAYRSLLCQVSSYRQSLTHISSSRGLYCST
jgi:hypothetical protein